MNTPFPRINITGHSLLPIIQGGMGIGVSAHRLAGTVANLGAIGTIASVELRRLHPDLMERTGRCKNNAAITEANLEALDREIKAARQMAPNGFIAVNVMRAVTHYAELVKQACASGANAIIMGAGLPLELPELTKEYNNIALIPILSEERGVSALVKRWLKRGSVPAAIVLEHPGHAGGHLGASDNEDVKSDRFNFSHVLSACRSVLEKLGHPNIPLIAAGGVNSFEAMRQVIDLGANGAQIGTPFAVTEEGDADAAFKKVLTDAEPKDIVTFMSAAGLPARAVLTPWLKKYLSREKHLREHVDPTRASCPRRVECLTHCGFKDGNPKAGQFCIETQLAAAQRGDVQRGLFFRGAESLPFGKDIRPASDLLHYLLTGQKSTIVAAGS